MRSIVKMQLLICVACVILASVRVGDSLSPLHRAVRNVASNGHVGKKGQGLSSYSDYARNEDPTSRCASETAFEISQNYIIRTKDSKENGATFVTAKKVRTYDVCLEQCCLTDGCDTTVFVLGDDAYSSDEANCFLFGCRPDGETGSNLCLFTYHDKYISSIMKVHGGFQDPVPVEVEPPIPVTTAEPLIPRVTTSPTPAPVPVIDIEPDPLCNEGFFECDSGQCINELYVCNGVIDCDDESDEFRCSTGDADPKEPAEQQGPDNTDSAPEPVVVEAKPEPVVTVISPQAAIRPEHARTNGTTVTKEKEDLDNVGGSDEVILTHARGGSGMPPASSAILPLVVGLIITVCLLLMVGCRLRYMNQRLRYGRLKTSAHDADYLINGMYL